MDRNIPALEELLALMPDPKGRSLTRSRLFYSAKKNHTYLGCVLDEPGERSAKGIILIIEKIEKTGEPAEEPQHSRHIPQSPIAEDIICKGASFTSWHDKENTNLIFTLINPNPVPLTYETLPGIGKEFTNPDPDDTLGQIESVLNDCPRSRPDPTLFRGIHFFKRDHDDWTLTEISNTVERYPDDDTGRLMITFRATYTGTEGTKESNNGSRLYASLTFTPTKDKASLDSYIEARVRSKKCESVNTIIESSETHPFFIHITDNSEHSKDIRPILEHIRESARKYLK